MNQRTEPTPANVREPGKRVPRSPVVAEIHYQRSPRDGARVYKPPITGISRVVAIVAQHEILVERHPQRPPRVARGMIAAPLLVRPRRQMLPLPAELGIELVV